MSQRSAHLSPAVERKVMDYLAENPVTFARLVSAALWHFLVELCDAERAAAVRRLPRRARQSAPPAPGPSAPPAPDPSAPPAPGPSRRLEETAA